MPHPIVYNGGQDDDLTRAIDAVHIEPSIREGVHLVSSLYGSDASAPLYRFTVLNTGAPWITGDRIIPAVLLCNVGQWQGSPAPVFEFQWMSDGVDIPGATDQTWLSDIAYDNTNITCEVKGFNYKGQDYALTPDFPISIIEPIEINEQENYAIFGLHAPQIQTIRDERSMVVSGLAGVDRLDINRSVSYFITGSAAVDRHDINAMDFLAASGISQDQTQTIQNSDGIAVISTEVDIPLVDGIPQALPLRNPEAELGMLGWEIFGAVEYTSEYKKAGYYSWWGGDDVDAGQGNTPYSYMWQDVVLYDGHVVDIDAGTTHLELDFYQFSASGSDQGNVKLEFYDALDQVLTFEDGPGLWGSPSGIFYLREIRVRIPANTRKIRVIPEFNLQVGTDNNAAIDSIAMRIRKGDPITGRNFGPNFKFWRIRFTQANTWSGGGLSELEFRASIGGADLCVGGSPIFGSAGLGVANADYAFDDLRNTGYWAGEENGIANGTAWIGYEFPTPVFPQEIDITARTGSNSLQVPKEFYLEGSDDGINWMEVMWVDDFLHNNSQSYASGEQVQIPIAAGPIPFWKDHPDLGGTSYIRSVHSTDNFWGKGVVHKAIARFNITKLATYIDDNVNTPINFTIQLARLNQQKTGGYWQIGMVTEVLEEIDFTSPGTNSGEQWMEHVLAGTYEMEVGDLFLVRLYDHDAATNPDEANEGRTRWVNGYSDGVNQKGLRRTSEFMSAWTGGGATLLPGYANPTPYLGINSTGPFWAVDYAGDVF